MKSYEEPVTIEPVVFTPESGKKSTPVEAPQAVDKWVAETKDRISGYDSSRRLFVSKDKSREKFSLFLRSTQQQYTIDVNTKVQSRSAFNMFVALTDVWLAIHLQKKSNGSKLAKICEQCVNNYIENIETSLPVLVFNEEARKVIRSLAAIYFKLTEIEKELHYISNVGCSAFHAKLGSIKNILEAMPNIFSALSECGAAEEVCKAVSMVYVKADAIQKQLSASNIEFEVDGEAKSANDVFANTVIKPLGAKCATTQADVTDEKTARRYISKIATHQHIAQALQERAHALTKLEQAVRKSHTWGLFFQSIWPWGKANKQYSANVQVLKEAKQLQTFIATAKSRAMHDVTAVEKHLFGEDESAKKFKQSVEQIEKSAARLDHASSKSASSLSALFKTRIAPVTLSGVSRYYQGGDAFKGFMHESMLGRTLAQSYAEIEKAAGLQKILTLGHKVASASKPAGSETEYHVLVKKRDQKVQDVASADGKRIREVLSKPSATKVKSQLLHQFSSRIMMALVFAIDHAKSLRASMQTCAEFPSSASIYYRTFLAELCNDLHSNEHGLSVQQVKSLQQFSQSFIDNTQSGGDTHHLYGCAVDLLWNLYPHLNAAQRQMLDVYQILLEHRQKLAYTIADTTNLQQVKEIMRASISKRGGEKYAVTYAVNAKLHGYSDQQALLAALNLLSNQLVSDLMQAKLSLSHKPDQSRFAYGLLTVIKALPESSSGVANEFSELRKALQRIETLACPQTRPRSVPISQAVCCGGESSMPRASSLPVISGLSKRQ